MTWDSQHERRQSYCPTCKTKRGTPRGVSVADGVRVIDYKCLVCGGAWRIQDRSRDDLRPRDPAA